MTKSLRILVVDDEPVNLEVAEVILRSADYDVQTCHNGREAVDLIVRDGQHFDVILMDVNMPVMDGFEATERIKAHEPTRGALVIFVSGSHRESDERRAVEVGGARYFRKPYRRKDLLEAVRHTLIANGHAAADELSAP